MHSVSSVKLIACSSVGSHRAGFAGLFGTSASAQETFDSIKTDHGFGAAGLTINFKDPPTEEFTGGLADGSPWEFQHKVSFGYPGTQMPAAADVNATNDDVADVGAHSQALPIAP